MANIKKNFNFRNGVQVDDDNLLVTSTGLVGIGTTVPTEALDVRGNVKIIGDATITNATVGVLTITEVSPTQIIGAGVSIKSGIITASGSGIVTFFGDATNLLNMPTSQWQDTNAGFGVSSIYNTGGTVGIATTNPKSTLQIGDNPDIVGGRGVGISSVGDINASGIITATTFSGVLVGNVTGDLTGNTQGIHTGAVNLGDNVKAKFGDSGDLEIFHDTNNSKIKDTGSGTLDILSSGVNIKNAGDTVDIAKFDGGVGQVQLFYNNSKKFSTSGVGVTITSQLDTTNLNVSGVSTFSEDVITGVGATVGIGTDVFFGDNIKATFGNGNEVKMFHKPDTGDFRAELVDTNYVILSRTLDFKNQAGNKATITAFEPGGIPEVRLFNNGNEKLRTTGFGVTIFNQLDTTNIVASGVITATTELNSPLIGVGTDTPANDIQVRKSGNTEIQVTSDTGSAGLTVGREPSTGNTNNAEFRYGVVSGGSPYSSAQSVDILNYGTGNFNYHLSANNPGAVAGNFNWHKGLNNTRLMTLTNTGRLGIGETQPTTTLYVSGVSTVTSNSFVGGTLGVAGNASIGGNLSVSGSFSLSSTLNANVRGNLIGNLTGSVNNTGISTFARVAIGTYYPADGVELDGSQIRAVFNNIAIGTTEAESGADFKNCGAGVTDRFLIPPTVTTTQRNTISTPVDGGLIFNSTANRLEVYLQNAWVGIATVT